MTNPEQAKTQSPEDKAAEYKEMPEIKELKSLSTDTQRILVNRFASEDQVDKHSETPVKDSKPAEEPKSKEAAKEQPPTVKDKTDPSEEDKQVEKDGDVTEDDKLQRQYKELQGEFTRRNQKMSEIDKENALLRERVAKMEGRLEATPKETVESDATLDALDELAKENPKVATLVNAIKKSMEAQSADLRTALEDLKAKEDTREQTQTTDSETANAEVFSKSLDEFLAGPLKDLQPELDAILAESYGDLEGVMTAAKTNPDLFESIKGQLFLKHFEKVQEAIEKEAENKEEDPKERQKQIDETGVSGKPTTTAPSPDVSDFKKFKALSTADKKKQLQKLKLVEDE